MSMGAVGNFFRKILKVLRFIKSVVYDPYSKLWLFVFVLGVVLFAIGTEELDSGDKDIAEARKYLANEKAQDNIDEHIGRLVLGKEMCRDSLAALKAPRDL